jgi:hypothetical protein
MLPSTTLDDLLLLLALTLRNTSVYHTMGCLSKGQILSKMARGKKGTFERLERVDGDQWDCLKTSNVVSRER